MPPAPSPRRFAARRVVFGVVLSAAGLALLVWQIKTKNPTEIKNALAQVGWGFLVILAISLARFSLRAFAWMTLMGRGAPLASALGATIAGDAIGNLTPLSLLISEPAKSLYLRDTIPVSRSLAALTAENFFYSLSVAIFIVAGILVMLNAFVVPPDLRAAGLLSLGLMAAVIATAGWIAWREPALISATVGRIPFPPFNTLASRIRQFESTTYGFARQPSGRLGVIVACETAFHLLSFAESYYTLLLITGRSEPLAALILDTVNRVVSVVFRALPLRVGVDEWGTGIVAPAVGLTSAVGVALALVRKGRMLVWAAIGLVLSVRKGLRIQDVLGNRSPGDRV